MSNEQWPFNGKSLWASMQPGQKFAAIVGAPIIAAMMSSLISLVDWAIPWPMLRAVFVFVGFFALPWVYVHGIGTFIAALFQLLFVRRR